MTRWGLMLAILGAAPLAAQQDTVAPFKIPSAQFAARVGCDSATILGQRAALLQRAALPGDSGVIVLTAACEALAWLGQPKWYNLETLNGEPTQQIWHYDHDTLPAPVVQPGHPWVLSPALSHRPPHLQVPGA